MPRAVSLEEIAEIERLAATSGGLDPLLDTPQAARWLGGLPDKTLEAWRCSGDGPEFVKLGRRVFYLLSALKRWRDQNTHKSTSERAE